MKATKLIFIALIALLPLTTFSEDKAKLTSNTYVFDPSKYEKGVSHFVTLRKVDERWAITSLNQRKTVINADEEVIFARRNVRGGWEFNPYFHFVTNNGALISCYEDKPKGHKEGPPIDRTKYTNLCDSKFITS